jgi:hypothetical protein
MNNFLTVFFSSRVMPALFCLLAIIPAAQAATDAQLATVAAMIQKGDTVGARSELNRLLTIEPNNPTLKALLSSIPAAPPAVTTVSKAAPTLEQTTTWLCERLVGVQPSYWDRKISEVTYKEGWLYLKFKDRIYDEYCYIVPLSSLDGKAEERLVENYNKSTYGNKLNIITSGQLTILFDSSIRHSSFDGSVSYTKKREVYRELSFNATGGYEFELKLAKAFDHAARLSGGGKEDLF